MDNKIFIPGKSYIPVSGATITQGDKKILHECVEDGWYTEGKWCRRFEKSLSEVTGKELVRLVNSGSSASLVAMLSAVKINPSGKYVLTCATGFPTTVSPIYQAGKIPLFIDINPRTLEPDYSQFMSAIESFNHKICGAIFTHTLGIPFEEYFVSQFLDEKFLISDCCDALGSHLSDDTPVGSYSNLSTYSFFPAHHVSTGEGGAVATDNSEYNELVRCYSEWGRSCFCKPGQTNTCGKRFTQEYRGLLPEGWDHKYIFTEIGYNLKMTEFQGALGFSQLERLYDNKEKRRNNYEFLLYQSYPSYMEFIPLGDGTNPFGFPIMVKDDAPFNMNNLVFYLEEKNIRTRRLFGGNLTKQPAFLGQEFFVPYSLSGSDKVMNDMIWIGCHEALTEDMLEYVVKSLKDFKG